MILKIFFIYTGSLIYIAMSEIAESITLGVSGRFRSHLCKRTQEDNSFICKRTSLPLLLTLNPMMDGRSPFVSMQIGFNSELKANSAEGWLLDARV